MRPSAETEETRPSKRTVYASVKMTSEAFGLGMVSVSIGPTPIVVLLAITSPTPSCVMTRNRQFLPDGPEASTWLPVNVNSRVL